MQEWSSDGVRQERSGWRDESLSRRHREWGFNCPAVDLDFLMVEYNLGKPVGLVEYKHHQARMPSLNHATYRALSELATVANLPFVIAFYWPSSWAFRVYPVNNLSQQHFTDPEDFTERDFVRRLYKLRRLKLTEQLEGKLYTLMPPRAA